MIETICSLSSTNTSRDQGDEIESVNVRSRNMSGLTYAVTGVASGIGAEMVRILKECGHCVIGLDICDTKDNIGHFISLDLLSPL